MMFECRRIATFVLFGIVMLNADASAQEMQPLAEYMALPSDLQEPSYPYVRCSSLYVALGGALSEDQIDEMADAAAAMLYLASLVRRSRGADPNSVDAQVGQDMENIASLYRARMDQNYAATGTMFSNDPVITSDMPVCKQIAEYAMHTVSEYLN